MEETPHGVADLSPQSPTDMSLNYSHLPSWLENNRLFRFFFLIRKIFITKRVFRHFGQFAEDVTIGRLFPKSYKGFFVDVGCFHPVKYNNTYALYRRGWRGINIDIDSIKIDGFRIARPRDTNIAAAVSTTEGEVTVYSDGFYSLNTTLDPKYAAERGRYREKTLPASRLDRLIDGTKYKDSPIDLLTVDAESHDLEVLKSLDFERYAPKVVAVETHLQDLDAVADSELYQFITAKGYSLAGWCGLTLVFRRRERAE